MGGWASHCHEKLTNTKRKQEEWKKMEERISKWMGFLSIMCPSSVPSESIFFWHSSPPFLSSKCCIVIFFNIDCVLSWQHAHAKSNWLKWPCVKLSDVRLGCMHVTTGFWVNFSCWEGVVVLLWFFNHLLGLLLCPFLQKKYNQNTVN